MPTKTTRPAKKRTAKKAPRKSAARKVTKRTAKPRTMSASHKKALADGRTMSSAVDRYLELVNAPKQRGRKMSTKTIEARIAKASSAAKQPGVKGLIAIQELRDLQIRLDGMSKSSNGAALQSAEAEFIKIAKPFSEKRGIIWGSWRDAGVPAAVLQKAGIKRTRRD